MHTLKAVGKPFAAWRAGWVIVLAVCFAGTAGAVWIDAEAFFAPDEATWYTDDNEQMAWTGDMAEAAYTVRSVVRVESNTNTLQAIHLVRMAPMPDDGRPAFDVVWQPDPMSWGTTWVLQLPGVEGVFPGAILSRHRPQTGHTYETLVSHNPHSGVLSVFVRDVTDDTVLINKGLPLPTAAAPLRLGAGFRTKGVLDAARPPVTVVSLELSPQTVPVGTTMTVAVHDSDTDTWLPLRRFNMDDTITVQVNSADPTLPGMWRLAYRNEERDAELARWEQPPAQFDYSVPATDLPLGEVFFVLEYVDQALVLFTHTQFVEIGQVDVHLGRLTVNVADDTLVGTAHLSSAAAMQNVVVTLRAHVTQWLWDDMDKQYKPGMSHTYPVLDVAMSIPGPDGVDVPFVIPMPDEPGVWEVTFNVQGSVHVDVLESGGRRLFATATQDRNDHAVPEPIKVCTYNVMGFQGWPETPGAKALGEINSPQRVAHFAKAVNELDCDILGIQEGRTLEWLGRLAQVVNVEAARFPSPVAFPGAVFSRYPILDARDFSGGLHPAGIPYSRTAGSALLDVNGRLLWVVNIHAHPTQLDLREAEADILGRHVDELLNVTPYIIVLGDFNSPTGTVIHETLRERGFVNTMDLAGVGPRYTMTNLHGVGTLAIDHIYVSPSLLGAVEASWVVSDPGFKMPSFPDNSTWVHSDHLPVAAQLLWQ